jgi:glycosyltransferase involved in cell wall biosynthesis
VRLAYIVSRFPCLTETFVLREIQSLQALNWPIEVFGLHHMHTRVVHAAAASMEHSVHFVSGPTTVLRGLRVLRSNSVLRHQMLAADWRSKRGFAKALMTLGAAAEWSEQMRDLHVEHVHAHFGSYPALAALVAAELLAIDFSFTVHAHDLFADNQLLAEKARRARFVATISEFNRQRLIDLLGPNSADRIRVIHCGVDLESFAFKQHSSHVPPIRLVCVAGLREYKGLEHLIDACALLRAARPELPFECRIVGDGPLRDSLEQQIRRRGLHQYVRLEGERDEVEVQRVLASADLFVLPSVRARNGYMDGIPVALMEAMASGVPVIASRLSGIPELVRDEVTGLLVEPGNANGLCEAMLRMLREPALTQRRASLARGLVEREYDLSRTTRQLAREFATIEGSGRIP